MPQRRALIQSLNFQNRSGTEVFEHFYFEIISGSKSVPARGVMTPFQLRNVLRTTAACTFLTLQLPKVLRERGAFCILIACNLLSLRSQDGFAPAALASLLFDPSEPQNIGKTQCFASRLFNLSAHLDVLSSDYFSSLIFFVVSFPFSASSHLRCFISPYCREFDFLRFPRSYF